MCQEASVRLTRPPLAGRRRSTGRRRCWRARKPAEIIVLPCSRRRVPLTGPDLSHSFIRRQEAAPEHMPSRALTQRPNSAAPRQRQEMPLEQIAPRRSETQLPVRMDHGREGHAVPTQEVQVPLASSNAPSSLILDPHHPESRMSGGGPLERARFFARCRRAASGTTSSDRASSTAISSTSLEARGFKLAIRVPRSTQERRGRGQRLAEREDIAIGPSTPG